jgi:hypothetical protein
LEPEEGGPGESGNGRRRARGVWNRKREDQGSLAPEEGEPGESGNGRGKNRGVWNRKREEQGSLDRKREDRESVELNEKVQGVLQKILKSLDGRGI